MTDKRSKKIAEKVQDQDTPEEIRAIEQYQKVINSEKEYMIAKFIQASGMKIGEIVLVEHRGAGGEFRCFVTGKNWETDVDRPVSEELKSLKGALAIASKQMEVAVGALKIIESSRDKGVGFCIQLSGLKLAEISAIEETNA